MIPGNAVLFLSGVRDVDPDIINGSCASEALALLRGAEGGSVVEESPTPVVKAGDVETNIPGAVDAWKGYRVPLFLLTIPRVLDDEINVPGKLEVVLSDSLEGLSALFKPVVLDPKILIEGFATPGRFDVPAM